jgi:hypothetical protein
MRSQDDDRIVDLFERFERLCRNAEDGGQHPGWKPAEGLTYADVVFGFGRTGVLDDHYFHVARATVLEVVERSLGCEHDVVDVGIETLVVAVPVDDDPSGDSTPKIYRFGRDRSRDQESGPIASRAPFGVEFSEW